MRTRLHIRKAGRSVNCPGHGQHLGRGAVMTDRTCACGCRAAVKPNRTWVQGHNKLSTRVPRLCLCLCGQYVKNKGWCVKGHYRRTIPAPMRFWPRVAAPDAKGCTEWTGGKDGSGYGMFPVPGLPKKTGSVRAHRYAWELTYGFGSIPDGLQLDHLCRNRACVNVEHLEVVTQMENFLRGFSPQAVNHRKTRCKRGHPFDDMNTIPTPTGGRRCRICKNLNGVAYRLRKQDR